MPPVPRCPSLFLAVPLSVRPPYLLLEGILIGRAGQCLAAGPGQPDLAGLHRPDQQAESIWERQSERLQQVLSVN